MSFYSYLFFGKVCFKFNILLYCLFIFSSGPTYTEPMECVPDTEVPDSPMESTTNPPTPMNVQQVCFCLHFIRYLVTFCIFVVVCDYDPLFFPF